MSQIGIKAGGVRLADAPRISYQYRQEYVSGRRQGLDVNNGYSLRRSGRMPEQVLRDPQLRLYRAGRDLGLRRDGRVR